MLDLDTLQAAPLVLNSTPEVDVCLVGPHMHRHTDLLSKFFALRSEVFVHTLGWSGLTDANGFEIDEYDLSTSYYLLIVRKSDQAILAGLRVCPTHLEQNLSPLSDVPTSYMIRDAHLGRLSEISSSICNEAPPADVATVELTRLISRNPKYLKLLIHEASKYLVDEGITQCLILASPTFLRLGRQLGYAPFALGPEQSTPDGEYQAIAYDPSKRATSLK